jgi:hypothetical protein
MLMHYPSRLFVEPPTPTRPVYDIPPVMAGSARWPYLRTLRARLRVRAANPERRPARRGSHQR